MESNEINSMEGFLPVYKEIADIIGSEYTYALYKNLRGQQLTLPKRLYTAEFVVSKVIQAKDANDIRKFAKEYDYQEKYLKQLLKQQREVMIYGKKTHQNN